MQASGIAPVFGGKKIEFPLFLVTWIIHPVICRDSIILIVKFDVAIDVYSPLSVDSRRDNEIFNLHSSLSKKTVEL